MATESTLSTLTGPVRTRAILPSGWLALVCSTSPFPPWNTSLPLATRTQTSDRAELKALTWALQRARGPTHIKTDNEYVANHANAMIADLARNVTPRIPAMHGDLWSEVLTHILRLGIDAVAATWIKGHAKQKDVDQGIITQEDMYGNCNADTLAGIGRDLWQALPPRDSGTTPVKLSPCLSKR